ncbi:MAG: peptidoglycan-associated lipoprotein Pal [Deltaproteobacteria bacterium]|nr:peptidoglycan-associated lipoprotein Pal [Deltaproteobacteria bacterium]MBW2340514.1 peptidoglycan-associated lipoprotein Pal [Deltaproteobacteria bacterium]
MKRNLVVATLVVFAFSSILLLSSCAKKQVITEEKEMEAPAPEVAKVEEEKPAVPAAKEEKMEEAKIERLKELEEAKKREAAIDEEKAWMERRAAKFEAEAIYFDFDKSFIKLEYRPVLQEKAAFLKDYPDMRVRIEGNCDERGTNEYNLALGERRGNSAKNFFISLGIAADRIETISYGEERPRALGHNEVSWSQNRRDDFVLVR